MGKSEKKGKKRKHVEDEAVNNNPIKNSSDTEESKSKKSKEIASADQMLEVVKVKAALEKTHESKRSKKRKKQIENAENSRSRADKKYLEEITEYLKLWETDRSSWKFQKMKQIFIQNHVFDLEIIVDDIWNTALEYLSGSQGKSKEMLKEKAESIIRQIDSEVETTSNMELMEQPLYKRAREMLQMLD